ncbi:DEAD/DEAH box helicase [Bradyrhizobium sp. WBOS7]|uniref:Type I restriction enzyme endonuclease subunit n=1 Tax=Bradyrhizobium betae TaxID=244734 RepID=A0AAE9N9I9_9BRAD|nr:MULTISPECIES: type I restriction endonuclease subunit R [Bradyrhizobium]MDD1574355.1 DEAD/DEAH box helicase [Bradyrhizobium sp. WBOS1]UUO33792.1 DEAD/DEAH box helicase [Bradyrhizobium sp. WBOS01]MDD1530898.1 DEAD/DEAH box helicase [Bradyrhizobium sp. WBOS2]MDD1580390.1 DEAD/DEAH box helicase [Bradyrhizobium sp. WBOS7]MDD1603692.1 DEAD/DEAH box helicase [Bradyrhizobium sp. WBOS16]
MAYLSEADVEQLVLDRLSALGYAVLSDADIGPDGKSPERETYSDVILQKRLSAAIEKLNPSIPSEARGDALRKILATEHPSLTEENRRLHGLMVDGVDVEFFSDDGTIRGDKVRLIDFDDFAANDWIATSQFTAIEGRVERRPDVVIFVNGLPLSVIELKAPGGENATIYGAYNQLQTYKAQIASLFRTNAVLVTSDGITARVGSLTADQERFMPWRTTDGKVIAPKGQPELTTLVEGVFERQRFLDLLRDFTVFGETGSSLAKMLAGYHQFHAVKRAVASTVRALALNNAVPQASGLDEEPATYGLPGVENYPRGDKRIGVIWHTQGSGKSLLMAFYAGQLVRHPALENPTIVVITDRNDLDDQLFGTFSMCRDLIRQTPVQAGSRDDLRAALNRASGGVIFTTIQKFSPAVGEVAYPMLSDRRNIVVIADEAHRSQYGFRAKVEQKTGEISYGFAKYLRDALPNASFIGFTGTPIEKDDVNTPAIFGDYIDVYDISRAVEDGATVPIYYESRLARIELPDEEKPKIDAEIAELTEDEAITEQERIKRRWATIEALVGSKKRLALVAADLVRHFEDRVAAMDGKAMVVCMSRRICVELYNQIVTLRPDWHSDEDAAGSIKVVMTGSAADPPAWQPHIGTKARRDLLAKRAKDPKDQLKLVMVRDMWLTGFDAPSMHTMYIDKPMKGHGLMQAIARVNRVFRDKPAGLVVDYIGIAQNLKNALSQYSGSDQRQAGIDEAQAIALLLEKHEVVQAMYHGFDYARGLSGTPHERLVALAEAIEWILDRQHEAAAKETSEDGKRRENRRYQDAVLALSKAFALASASDEARAIRDEVGFFQAVRAALVKSADTAGTSAADREFAIQQILDRAVVSTEIIDVLAAAGITTPDISILSDEFLAEVQQLEKKNLALEALRKLLNDEIRSRSKTNVVETKRFSERLEAAIARYHTNAISTVEVLQELIELAKEVRAARRRGEEEGLSQDEIAFYDALAENESAVEAMGNDSLKLVAHELLVNLKGSATVDWSHRESARARMRVLVKRILRKHGYPPDLQDAAVQTVLRQAEALSSGWAIS